MSPLPVAPSIVLALAEHGPFAEFKIEGTVWAMDEGRALLRHYVDLLALHSPAAGDALVALHIAVGEAGLKRHTPPDAPIACKMGCSHCCHQHVSVSALEVFYIARRLRNTANRDGHVKRLDAKLANTNWDPSRDFDVRNPCAFLEDGACNIHSVRPMICRIVVSLDVSTCISQLVNGSGETPHPRAIVAMRGWLNPAIYAALQAAGLPVREYELTGAVRAVLADPTIETRWYRGDDALVPFSSAEETPDDIMLQEMSQWRAMANV